MAIQTLGERKLRHLERATGYRVLGAVVISTWQYEFITPGHQHWIMNKNTGVWGRAAEPRCVAIGGKGVCFGEGVRDSWDRGRKRHPISMPTRTSAAKS